MSLSGNYTLSRCFGIATTSRFTQTSGGLVDPNNPAYDEGYCDQDRKHLATLTVGYETPELDNAVMRALASHWRLSGILTAQSGRRLNILSGIDNAFTGIGNQRPNQVSDDFYPEERTLTNYFNRGGVRAAGARHAGQPSPQCRGGSGLLERQPGRVEADQRHRDAAVGSPHRDVQPLQPLQLGQSGS